MHRGLAGVRLGRQGVGVLAGFHGPAEYRAGLVLAAGTRSWPASVALARAGARLIREEAPALARPRATPAPALDGRVAEPAALTEGAGLRQ